MALSGIAVHPRLRWAIPEAWLTSAAARGNLDAFAALLERYEVRTFNLALRILDSEEEAAEATNAAFLATLRELREGLDRQGISFAFALASAVSEQSLAAIEQRGGASPPAASDAATGAAGGLADDPDGGLSLEDWHERMRSANGRLPTLARQVLALGELGGLSHGAIGAVMDVDPHSVAELVALARLDLRDELRGSDVAAREGPTEECSRADPLIAMRDDDQLEGHSDEAEWLIDHLVSCRDCRTRLDAMQEARLSYAAWDPIAPPPSLRGETLAQAAAIVVPGGDHGAPVPLAHGAAVRAEAAGGARPTASGGLALAAARIGGLTLATAAGRAARAALVRGVAGPASRAASTAAGKRRSTTRATPERRIRRRREALLAGGWTAVVALGVLALAVGGVFDTADGDDQAPKPVVPATVERVSPRAAEAKPRPARKRKKRSTAVVARPPRPQQVRPVPVVAAPPATPQPRPVGERPRRAPRPRRESAPRRTPPPVQVTPKPPADQVVPRPTPPAPAPGAGPVPANPPPAQTPTGCANPAGCPPG